jgi:hypothetical protein
MSTIDRAIEVLDMIIADTKTDAEELDGKELNGRNVAEQFGKLGAQVQALAKILKAHIKEEHHE